MEEETSLKETSEANVVHLADNHPHHALCEPVAFSR